MEYNPYYMCITHTRVYIYIYSSLANISDQIMKKKINDSINIIDDNRMTCKQIILNINFVNSAMHYA